MGKRAQAQEHLTTAMTMYREMDMRFWLEQAEAGLTSEEAPSFGSGGHGNASKAQRPN